ncbi:MAG: type II toxin-antitoxin system RelE/ParE family toxin [Flavobacteriaceae bacterium]|nr:type II toxin-antitoxin system RelE/ParE family toxin [Flavobacteriaceae bacterium]
MNLSIKLKTGIIWSDQAKISYDDIIDRLLVRWNPDIAEDFENRTNNV